MSGMQMMMLGGAGDRVLLDGATLTPNDVSFSPNAATAVFSLLSSGSYTGTNEPGGSWVVPAGSASLYECLCTVTSGSLTSGTTGSWLALSVTRTWTRERTTPGVTTASVQIQIRRIGTTTTLSTFTVNFSAQVE